jgi:hypothetical protein
VLKSANIKAAPSKIAYFALSGCLSHVFWIARQS